MFISCENSVFIADIGTSFTKSGPSSTTTPNYFFNTPPCLVYSKIIDLPVYLSLIPNLHTVGIMQNECNEVKRRKVLCVCLQRLTILCITSKTSQSD
ncbi:hypothetical protein BDAP_001214 [Binucleata daphniae]